MAISARNAYVNDWYQVLGVRPDATQQEISEAFARLVPHDRDPNETEDQAEQRRLVEHAYGVIGDPGRRAQYDAERAAAGSPAQAGGALAPERKPSSLWPILAGVAVVAAIVVVTAALVIVLRDDTGRAYPDRTDEGLDLEQMRLVDEDLPTGFTFGQSFTFDNAEWGGILNEEDPESAQRGLEAEGRLRNLLAVYQSENLGRTLGIFSISTVYTDDSAASRSLGLFCGLPVAPSQDIRAHAIAVPRFGDESAGFIADGVMTSDTYKETTMCFRTGNVVHAVSLASIPGVEDVALAVRLTEKMESHINDYYDGKTANDQQNKGS